MSFCQFAKLLLTVNTNFAQFSFQNISYTNKLLYNVTGRSENVLLIAKVVDSTLLYPDLKSINHTADKNIY